MPGRSRGGPSGAGRPSPAPAELAEDTRFLAVAQLQAPRGIHGDMRALVLTDFPKRLKNLTRAFLGEEHSPVEVERTRLLPNGAIIKLRGVDTPEAARSLANQLLYVPLQDAVPLPEDQFYWYQIIGLEVWTRDERLLGKVKDILTTGSNDVYVVAGEAGEILIPAIEDVVTAIEIPRGRITVDLIEGLM